MHSITMGMINGLIGKLFDAQPVLTLKSIVLKQNC